MDEHAKLRKGLQMDTWTNMVTMRLDTSGDDEISWEEFEQAMFFYMAKEIFNEAAGADGKLSAQELQTKLAADNEIEELLGMDEAGLNIKRKITAESWASILHDRIDESKDGIITWDEFQNGMLAAMMS